MDQVQLQTWLDENAAALEVPGVAIGVYHAGAEHYAFHGVTSVDNPLPVDANTLFLFGSTQKTYTATAIMCLVDQGKVSLDEKVRMYIPELKLKDAAAAREVTVLQLLNHTAGWSGDNPERTGDGDDALARFVDSMVEFDQPTPLGSAFSYNNASLNVAGRVIEKVTGQTYEAAMKELILAPLGLKDTLYFPMEVMTRRFAVGHKQDPDGTIRIARPWALSRAGCAAGGFGVCATAADQIAWAKFHLGDGSAADGTRVLSKELLDSMKQPTFTIAGSALGDAVGISWFLRDVDGVQTVSHGGDVIGQHSEFVMVPERDFAVIVLTNCDTVGSQLKDQAVRWALESYLGVVDKDPEPVAMTPEQLAPYVGTYEVAAGWVDITPHDGGLVLNVRIKPEAISRLLEEGEEVPEQPPIPIGMLAGEGDLYIVSDGAAKGMRGYFVRDASGEISSVHVGGRLAMRTAGVAVAS